MKSRKFGWPKKMPNRGFFWTDLDNFKSCDKLLDRVRNINYSKWLKIIKRYQDLCPIDKDNNNIKQIIKNNI